jgi:putative transposon-encoded protein
MLFSGFRQQMVKEDSGHVVVPKVWIGKEAIVRLK